MDEPKNENNAPSISNDLNKEAIMNLANNLTKNENTIDMSSIMRMATNLLTDNSLMNSVKELGNVNKAPAQDEATTNENQNNKEITAIFEQMEKLMDEISKMNKNLMAVLEQNEQLIKLMQPNDKSEKKRKKY